MSVIPETVGVKSVLMEHTKGLCVYSTDVAFGRNRSEKAKGKRQNSGIRASRDNSFYSSGYVVCTQKTRVKDRKMKGCSTEF